MRNSASRNHAWVTFAIAAVAGAAIWALSPVLGGHAEPWDAGPLYYHVALVASGAITALLAPQRAGVISALAIYAGVVIGQLAYEAVVIGAGPLFLLGVAFLLAYSLEFLAAALVAGAVRRALSNWWPGA